MAESLLPLKGRCPNIYKQGVLFGMRIAIWRLTKKVEKTFKVFKIIEYDTHQVILWRSRVGNKSRPKVCVCALHYCKRVVLGFPGVVPVEWGFWNVRDLVHDFWSR